MKKRVLLRALASVPVAVVGAVLLFRVPELTRQQFFLVSLVWPLAAAALLAPELLDKKKEVALAVAALALCAVAVKVAEEPLVRRMVPAAFDLDPEHRKTDCEYCSAGDGVVVSDAAPFVDSDFNIVFLGDSFAEGEGLDDRLDAFPHRIERALRGAGRDDVRVANFAWASSGPVLQLRQLRDLGRRYRPDLVVVAFDMTDFHDDLVYTAKLAELGFGHPLHPSVADVAEVRLGLLLGVADLGTWLLGRLRFVDPDELDEARIHSRQRRHFPMERPLDRSRELMEPTWGYLADLDAEADRLAAAFVVFVLPRYQHYNPDECPDDWARELFPRTDRYLMEPFRWFEEKAGTADFPVRSLLPAFVEAAEPQTVWRDDPHYNEIGHRIAADAMVEILREEGLLDP